MNSKELWNKLLNTEKVIEDCFIYPSKELNIKGKGKIKYLKKSDLPKANLAIYGALELYLDFINIFMNLLNIFGNSDD